MAHSINNDIIDHMKQALSLSTGWLDLAAIQWHSGQSKKILALHGWLDNASSFLPLAPHLEDVELVALDLPGHGHSDHRSPGQHYHFVDFVADVMVKSMGSDSMPVS